MTCARCSREIDADFLVLPLLRRCGPRRVAAAAVILAIYPGAIICGVLAYILGWLVIPPAPAATFEPSPSTS